MGAELSSLGIGSGVLTYDIIDQLREADESKLVGPTEKKLEELDTKQEALEEFMTLVSEFEDLQSDLSDELTWLNRTTEVNGDEVEVDVTGGVNPQTMNISIKQLAKQDILQSVGFNDRDTVVVTETINLDVFIDETSHKIQLDAGMTLADLAAKFSTSTDGAIIGSALNVGGEDPFKLILKSGEAGNSNRILLGNTKMGAVVDLANLPYPVNTDDISDSGNLKDTFFINGVDILAGKNSDELGSIDKVIEAINAQSDKTKVTAYESKDGNKIILNNANGDPIDFNGSDMSAGGVMDKLGLDGSSLNSVGSSTTTSGINIDNTTTLGSGSLEINGVDIFDDDFVYSDTIGSGLSDTNVTTSSLVINGTNIFDSTISISDWSNGGDKKTDLEAIVTLINNKSATTGVSSELFENSDGNYSIKYVDNTGSGIDFSGSDRMSSLGLVNKDTNVNNLDSSTTDGLEAIAEKINLKTADWYNKDGELQKGTGITAKVESGELVFSSEKDIEIKFTGTDVAKFGTTDVSASTTETESSEAIDTANFNLDVDAYALKINGMQMFSANANYTDLNTFATDLQTNINSKLGSDITVTVENGNSLKFINTSGEEISFDGSDSGVLETLNLDGQSVGGVNAQKTFLQSLGYGHTDIYDDGHLEQGVDYKENSVARVQTPQDSIFTFNGVEIKRTTNEVDDLVIGATIKLLKVHEDFGNDFTKAEVKRDDEEIKEKFKEAMEKYQEVNDKIMELIEYDYETKKIGPMQGIQEITDIKSIMTNHLLTYDVTLQFQSMISLGLEIERDGNIKIDFEKFNEELDDDPEAIEKLFRGYDTTILGEDLFIDGIWTKINNSLDDIIIDDESSLQALKKQWEKDRVSYEEEIEETKAEIEAKYERMATKFGAYDSMIAGMQNSFAPFEQMMMASYG